MSSRRLWHAFLFALCVGALGVGSPGTARSAFPGANGKIAFASERDGDFELYAMDADGSNTTRLTTNPADDREPAWSPDGSQIAFARNFEIWVMNADGTGAAQLTHNSGNGDEWPTWSPDGSKIAFTSYGGSFGAVYVMNKDGSAPTKLTDNPNNDFDPAWSPDGSKIAFVSDRNVFQDIYVMNADGTGQARLTTDPANDSDPAWSPDGSRIAFSSLRDGNSEIYVMNADGSGQTRLTNDPAADAFPTWSPDGQKIAFTHGRGFDAEIYVMNAGGSGQTNLTDSVERDDYADWQPLQAPPPPPGACITLSETSVSVTGTASTPSHRGIFGTDPDRLTITNCGTAPVHLAARGTDATGSAGSWQLVDQGTGSTCELGLNVFRASFALLLSGGGVGVGLSTQDRLLPDADGTTPFTLAAGAAQEASPSVEMPCAGSVGLGDPMTTNVTLTAIAP